LDVRQIKDSFRRLFGDEARVFSAPGRVNLIGEHTDYNDGFVLPAAIDLSTWVAVAPRTDRRLIIHSENFDETVVFELDDANAARRGKWSDYPRGVAVLLSKAGYRLSGASLYIEGDIPIGSGLSSSAAVAVATAYALLSNDGIAVDPMQVAVLCQRAENEFVGTHCGLMDQFISCFGRTGHAVLLDCRSLDYESLPLARDVKLVICNTMVSHQLASGEYNRRRAECEQGVQILSHFTAGVSALRDISSEDLERHRAELTETVYRRCRHVVTENARVLEAKAALNRADLSRLSELMKQSHLSLRDDYEVSCSELDLMVELANQVTGVYGARMTGGGFGGCTVNLVQEASVNTFRESVARGYKEATGRQPEIYVCSPEQGAREVTVQNGTSTQMRR